MHMIVNFINVNKHIFKRRRNGTHYSGEIKALRALERVLIYICFTVSNLFLRLEGKCSCNTDHCLVVIFLNKCSSKI